MKLSHKTEKAPKRAMHNPLQPSVKTFQEQGKWIEKRSKTQIFICECGNKYLKTRKNQTMCLRCISRSALIRK